jgi:glucose-1-phosphate thymidylyltransferase
MDNVRIGPHSHLSYSIIAGNISLGSYFATETKEKVCVRLDNELVEAGKLGTVIGDDCDIGLRVLTKAGVLISKGCGIESDTTIRDNIPEGSTVL